MRKIRLLLLSILLPGCLAGYAQGPDPEAPWLRIQQQVPDYKIHLHFDKAAWLPGETVWFTAYIFNQRFPDNSSRNFFIRLLNREGRLVIEKKLPLLAATAAANFDLPDSLRPGVYIVQALVPGMVYNDSTMPYQQPLYVAAALTPPAPLTGTDSIRIRFYPEGGSLISGVKSVLAFEAQNSAGQPVNVSFNLLTADGTVIRRTSATHNGMGRLDFTPAAGQQYKLQVNDPPRAVAVYQFPEIKTNGIALRISTHPSDIAYELARPGAQTTPNQVRLLVHQDYHVLFSRKLYFDQYQTLSGRLLTDRLRSGMLHFVVMDSAGNALAERTVFHNDNNYKSPITVTTDTLSFAARGYNRWSVQVADSIFASCSVSVTDADATIANPNADNIYSALLLSQDLQEPVVNPAWYFGNSGDSVMAATDLLMLTHHWRGFHWPEATHFKGLSKSPIKDPPYIALRGRVFDESGAVTLKKGDLIITVQHDDTGSLAFTVPVNELGYFTVDSLVCYGKSIINFTYVNEKGNSLNSKVILQNDSVNYWAAVPQAALSNTFASPLFLNTLSGVSVKDSGWLLVNNAPVWKNHRLVVMEMATVTGKTTAGKRPQDKVNTRYTRGMFAADAGRSVDFINRPFGNPAISIWDYIKTYLLVESAVYNNVNRIVSRTKYNVQDSRRWDITIFMDEFLIGIDQHETLLKSTTISDIAYIKFWQNGFLGAPGGAPGGAIAIYTKKQEDRLKSNAVKTTTLSLDGYSVNESFVSPNYSLPSASAVLNDNRSTLYWNGSLLIKPGEARSFSFYNNDHAKKMKLVIQGFDARGRFIYVERRLEK
jgi:hypothetical protein